MGPRISPFLPRRVDYLLRKRYPHRYGHALHSNVIHVSSSEFGFLVRQVADSLPPFAPLPFPVCTRPFSVHLLPLQCIPNTPLSSSSSSARPLSNAMPFVAKPLLPIRRSSRKFLIVSLFEIVINIDKTAFQAKFLRPTISLDQVATPRDRSCSFFFFNSFWAAGAVGPPPQCISRGSPRLRP